jgi:hypothetical protein
MNSRPEQGVVRQMPWQAAAFGMGAVPSEDDSPDSVPPPSKPGTGRKKRPERRGPGSQIRRYVPQPRVPPSPKPTEPDASEEIKQPD